MLRLSIDPKTNNAVLAALQIDAKDRLVCVKENGNIDSNFILTHLMKQIFYEQNSRLLLIAMHNTLEHYHNVGKKLGYDLKGRIACGKCIVKEPLQHFLSGIIDKKLFDENQNASIVDALIEDIQKEIDAISGEASYLVIDDVSHLLDLGVPVSKVLEFVGFCASLTQRDRLCVVVNTHVCNRTDRLIANSLSHVADVGVEVAPLTTGRSHDVTGLMTIERHATKAFYQYKSFDRGVKTFHPGEAIYHMYK